MDWQIIGAFLIYTLATLFCVVGLLLSALSLSGTWVILMTAGLLAWQRHPEFPSWTVLFIFLLLCIAVEVLEALASVWGVRQRGGSKTAGWAALGGGMVGMLLGGMLLPVFGSLLGLLAGSFGLAYAVEYSRLKKSTSATHIATGAVLARIGVILIKLTVTLAMIVTLVVGILMT